MDVIAPVAPLAAPPSPGMATATDPAPSDDFAAALARAGAAVARSAPPPATMESAPAATPGDGWPPQPMPPGAPAPDMVEVVASPDPATGEGANDIGRDASVEWPQPTPADDHATAPLADAAALAQPATSPTVPAAPFTETPNGAPPEAGSHLARPTAVQGTQVISHAAKPAQAHAASGISGDAAPSTGEPAAALAQAKVAAPSRRAPSPAREKVALDGATDRPAEPPRAAMPAHPATTTPALAGASSPPAATSPRHPEPKALRTEGEAPFPTGLPGETPAAARGDAAPGGPPGVTTRPSFPTLPPARQVTPVLVAVAIGGGTARLSVTLEPAELGRVEISVERSADAAQVQILAERPETLALLQRDQRELDRALSQAGIATEGRTVALGLAQQDGGQGQNASQGRRDAQTGRRRAASDPAAEPVRYRAILSLLDLAV